VEDWEKQMSRGNPRIGLLLGDPTGIGPELVAKLLEWRGSWESAEILLIGEREVFEQGKRIAGCTIDREIRFLGCPLSLDQFAIGKASAAGGQYVLDTISLAAKAFQHGDIDAIVYAPLNKVAMRTAGLAYTDEIVFFADRLGRNGFLAEISIFGSLWASRVTSHVPLKDVAQQIDADSVYSAISGIHEVVQMAGKDTPRIGVAALNPHAGESGLLGKEEEEVIGPAIERARRAGIDATGPWPADTMFLPASRGRFDAVVMMYHDQGQIALKLLGFNRGVTFLSGLPCVVTTPAHGTAFDIAGTGRADVGPIKEAFTIACRMARARKSLSENAAAPSVNQSAKLEPTK
jgi:4-hydroxythreonine-4-phosphate dehydrogenase